MPPLVLIPISVFAVAAIVFIIIRRKTLDKSKGKKIVLVGPDMSGKTTLVDWITKDDFIRKEYSPSGPREVIQYVDKKGRNIQITDFGGVEALIKEKFDLYIKDNDVLLFVFNLKEFIESELYRKEKVYPRVDFLLYKIKDKGSPKVLLIGSHRDKCDKTDAELFTTVCELFQSSNVTKAAQYPIIFADLTKRKYVTGILKELEKILDSIA